MNIVRVCSIFLPVVSPFRLNSESMRRFCTFRQLGFLWFLFFLLIFVSGEGFAKSELPACPSDPNVVWDKCIGVREYENDIRYIGEWENNKFHGLGLHIGGGGYRYVGTFRNGQPFGEGIEYQSDGRVNISLNNGGVPRSGSWWEGRLTNPYRLDPSRFPFTGFVSPGDLVRLRERAVADREFSKLVTANQQAVGLSWREGLDRAVQGALRSWLLNTLPGELAEVPTPSFPAPISLGQDPWETNKEFEDRVEKARQERRQTIDRLQAEYRTKVEERNRRVAEFNKVRAEREAALPAKRRELIQTALGILSPSVALSDVAFDQQTGALTLAAQVDGLAKQIFTFTGTALAFRRSALTEPQSLRAKPEFQVTDAGEIVLQAVAVEAGGAKARGLPSAGAPAPAVQLATVTLLQATPLAVAQQSALIVDRNQVEQILYRDENELLRKRLEDQRRQQEQAVALAEARATAENARLRAEVEELRKQPTPSRPPQNLAAVNEAHALVIGNSAYAGSNRLPNPVNDARAISAKLRALGFKVTEIRDAGREQMVRGLSEFSRTAARADLTLLFYAGHGVQIAGANYMIPVDLSLNDSVQASLQAVSLNQVVEQYLPGKTKLVFLDACRDNPLMASGARGVTKGLAPINVSEGTLIAYATKDGQTAEDGAGQTNSPFTTALLEHLADPEDIAVVLRTVRAKVMQRTNNRQQPWEYGSLTGGALVLSAIRR